MLAPSSRARAEVSISDEDGTQLNYIHKSITSRDRLDVISLALDLHISQRATYKAK